MLGFLRAIGDRLARLPRAVGALLAILWAGFIWWLSSGPPPDVPLPWRFALVFNLAHAPLYGVLALLVALSLPRAVVGAADVDGAIPAGPTGWPRFTPLSTATVLLIVLAYGAIDEWHQLSTPERIGGWQDVATDVCGAAATLAVASYLARQAPSTAGLWLRLALGLAACVACAAVATYS